MSGPGGAGGGGGDTSNYGDDSDMGEGAAMDASRDITHLKAIIEEAGIVDYDPRVVHLLLDVGNSILSMVECPLIGLQSGTANFSICLSVP
ncbi:hypothetical protein KIN20_004636 [Parelaphostrongylus tenuis]|uniref:Uncharacterized protein n=1 Tax=Parelaphostrongylus tenuis TaxID=148309 RepID=A0AAD5QFA6_PARTN|nr:hypothetical protein KIN20_004636 [Parelaphostrongylus tenuis]